MDTVTTPAVFEVGRKYTTRAAGDRGLEYTLEVARRTAKSITTAGNAVFRVSLTHDGSECVYPMGRYAKCPVMTARGVVAE